MSCSHTFVLTPQDSILLDGTSTGYTPEQSALELRRVVLAPWYLCPQTHFQTCLFTPAKTDHGREERNRDFSAPYSSRSSYTLDSLDRNIVLRFLALLEQISRELLSFQWFYSALSHFKMDRHDMGVFMLLAVLRQGSRRWRRTGGRRGGGGENLP